MKVKETICVEFTDEEIKTIDNMIYFVHEVFQTADVCDCIGCTGCPFANLCDYPGGSTAIQRKINELINWG